MTMGRRVSAEDEIGGLDLFEHGANAYPHRRHFDARFGFGGPASGTASFRKDGRSVSSTLREGRATACPSRCSCGLLDVHLQIHRDFRFQQL
jgi:hypothetical protein